MLQVGLIGLGTVGSALFRWFKNNTNHELKCFDPGKNLNDSLEGCHAIFISVPVPPADNGQDLSILIQSVNLAKRHTENVFVRSTVLPGTNDALKTVSCPEFLTARRPDEDMAKLDILMGSCHPDFAHLLFPKKQIVFVNNCEAELAKMAHNCFGAIKVTYFNFINQLAGLTGSDYANVLKGAMITGFIEPEHTMVPGPDGRFGYGGTCFPQNIEAMKQFMHFVGLSKEYDLLKLVQAMNRSYRVEPSPFMSAEEPPEVDA